MERDRRQQTAERARPALDPGAALLRRDGRDPLPHPALLYQQAADAGLPAPVRRRVGGCRPVLRHLRLHHGVCVRAAVRSAGRHAHLPAAPPRAHRADVLGRDHRLSPLRARPIRQRRRGDQRRRGRLRHRLVSVHPDASGRMGDPAARRRLDAELRDVLLRAVRPADRAAAPHRGDGHRRAVLRADRDPPARSAAAQSAADLVQSDHHRVRVRDG